MHSSAGTAAAICSAQHAQIAPNLHVLIIRRMSSSNTCTKCEKSAGDENIFIWPCGICMDCDGDFVANKHAAQDNSTCPTCLKLYHDSLPECKDCSLRTGADYMTPCGACHKCAAKGGKTAALAHHDE